MFVNPVKKLYGRCKEPWTKMVTALHLILIKPKSDSAQTCSFLIGFVKQIQNWSGSILHLHFTHFVQM